MSELMLSLVLGDRDTRRWRKTKSYNEWEQLTPTAMGYKYGIFRGWIVSMFPIEHFELVSFYLVPSLNVFDVFVWVVKCLAPFSV